MQAMFMDKEITQIPPTTKIFDIKLIRYSPDIRSLVAYVMLKKNTFSVAINPNTRNMHLKSLISYRY